MRRTYKGRVLDFTNDTWLIVDVDLGFDIRSIQHISIQNLNLPSSRTPVNSHEEFHARLVNRFITEYVIGTEVYFESIREDNSLLAVQTGRVVYAGRFNLKIKPGHPLHHGENGIAIRTTLDSILRYKNLARKEYEVIPKRILGVLYQTEEQLNLPLPIDYPSD